MKFVFLSLRFGWFLVSEKRDVYDTRTELVRYRFHSFPYERFKFFQTNFKHTITIPPQITKCRIVPSLRATRSNPDFSGFLDCFRHAPLAAKGGLAMTAVCEFRNSGYTTQEARKTLRQVPERFNFSDDVLNLLTVLFPLLFSRVFFFLFMTDVQGAERL